MVPQPAPVGLQNYSTPAPVQPQVQMPQPAGLQNYSTQTLPATALVYFEIKFLDKGVNRLEAEIVLNFLRQQYCGYFYWISKVRGLYIHDDNTAKKALVEEYTIIVAFHPSVSMQAQAEIQTKNCNFALVTLNAVEAFKIIMSCDEYKGVVGPNGDKTTVTEIDIDVVGGKSEPLLNGPGQPVLVNGVDNKLVNGMAAVQI
jgi:hypothetical protein